MIIMYNNYTYYVLASLKNKYNPPNYQVHLRGRRKQTTTSRPNRTQKRKIQNTNTLHVGNTHQKKQ